MINREEWYNDPETAQRTALASLQSGLWTCIPAVVTAIDFTENTLTAQPAIQGQITNEDGTTQYVNLPPLIHVPIMWPQVAGFALTMPIKVNDEVLIVFSSRCIDGWWQSGAVSNGQVTPQQPLEPRMHDLSDGFALIGIKSQPNKLSSISTTDAELRSTDRSTYIALTHDGNIKLVATSVQITGDVTVTGKVDADGEVTAKKNSTPIELSTHTHPVTTAPGTTGIPNP